MLDPSNEHVEKVCQSLVREYVIRREYSRTLRMFNEETAPLIQALGFYGSRLALGKDLGMEGLMKLNKESDRPLKSMLEVLVKCFLQDRELLHRSSFANSCYYTFASTQERRRRGRSKQRRKRQKESKEPQDAEERRQERQKKRSVSVIGSYSPPSSHSTTHQESFVSHLAYHQVNKDESRKESHSNANPLGIGKSGILEREQLEKTIHPEMTQMVVDLSAKEKQVAGTPQIFNEDPMATFCRKLQESRIMRNHSKTSLSLEKAQEDGGGDEYDGGGGGEGWTAKQNDEEPKSYTTSAALALDKRSNSIAGIGKGNDRMSSVGDIKSRLTLGQNLLESKQNLLAKVSLSPEENEIRQQVTKGDPDVSGTFAAPPAASSSATSPNKSPSSSSASSRNPKLKQQKSYSQSSSASQSSKSSAASSKSSTTVTTDQGFKFRDVDSLVTPTESSRGNSKGGPSWSQASASEFFQKSLTEDRRSVRSSLIKTMDMGTFQKLKATVLGDRGIMQEGWIGQGFTFNHNIPFALVQKKGGPCGVLAAVQALLLRNLMFGSAYCDPNELPLDDVDLEASPRAPAGVNITMKRSLALIGTLTEILWRCGSQGEEGGPHRTTSVTVGLTPGANAGSFGPGSELRIFSDLDDLKTFVEANLYRFDCIGLVYSVVLTRGIQSVQEDMDFSNSPLLGQHGYCTQELMNLLTIGRAISNAFDHEYVLDEKRLKGISSQADIGLLSLFEHYNSCTVGSFLKNPRFPLWIVCSESHFSLLFSDDMELTATKTTMMTTGKDTGGGRGGGGFMGDEGRRPTTFDLYYYDGLARQDKIIKLTINSSKLLASSEGNSVNQSNNNMIRGDAEVDDDLIPPLEKCIRTKWTGVVVDWNETEPIL